MVSPSSASVYSPDKPFCGRIDASIFLLSLIRSLGLRPSLLTLGRVDASIFLLSLIRSLGLRPSLLTLGRVDASIFLLSLIRSLDEVHHLLARHAD